MFYIVGKLSSVCKEIKMQVEVPTQFLQSERAKKVRHPLKVCFRPFEPERRVEELTVCELSNMIT